MRTWGLVMAFFGVLVMYLGMSGKAPLAWTALKGTAGTSGTSGGGTNAIKPKPNLPDKPTAKPDDVQTGGTTA